MSLENSKMWNEPNEKIILLLKQQFIVSFFEDKTVNLLLQSPINKGICTISLVNKGICTMFFQRVLALFNIMLVVECHQHIVSVTYYKHGPEAS
jgi:hypothetical protein